MAGLTSVNTTTLGNVNGRLVHYAQSSVTLLATLPADAERLYPQGRFRVGDLVLVQGTDDLRLCEVLAGGELRPQAAYPGGTGVFWDDLRFPSQGINPPGAASDPSTETATGLKLFSGSQTNILAGVAQMPHGWAEGSVVVPHVHWQKTTSAAGNVLWRFEYDNVVNPNEISLLTYANIMDAAATVAGTPDDNTAQRNLISSFGNLDMTDKLISSCILWKLSRIGGSDSYGANARLVEFDIHYQIDLPGSFQQFIKAPA